jgi:uncharacterized protein (TIGR02301 family)
MRRLALAAAAAAALLTVEACAAESPAPTAEQKSAPKASPPAAPPAEPALPPYEPQILRVAAMMGALAYLRDLCGANDGAQFRIKMQALLAADGVAGPERDLIAGAYNKGFDDYRLTYRTCTPAAGEIIGRYLSETAKIAAELATRYGG